MGRSADLNQCSKTKSEAEEWKRIEIELFNKVDIGLTFSYDEKKYLEKLNLECQIEQIPLFLYEQASSNVADVPEFADRSDFMFVGGFNHSPNTEGVLWFLEQVFPMVVKQLPEVKFHIIGSKMPDEVRQFNSKNVVIHGFVTDEELNTLYSNVRVNILPLLHGAGVKGKLVESLYLGTPVVSTSIGLEGVGSTKLLPASDQADSFSKRLIELLSDPVCWSKQQKNQYLLFSDEFLIDKKRIKLNTVF